VKTPNNNKKPFRQGTRLTAFFQDNLGNPAPERLTNLDFNDIRDDGVAVTSAGP